MKKWKESQDVCASVILDDTIWMRFHWEKTKNHFPGLQGQRVLRIAINYLLLSGNGKIPLSNNSSEQAVKIVALNRKNSLFSDSIAGAHASACVFSFISTAMSNGLDAYEYLNYLFTELPGKDLPNKDLLKAYLPWSDKVQAVCGIRNKKTKDMEDILDEPA